VSFVMGRVQVGLVAAVVVIGVVGVLDWAVLHHGMGIEGVPWLRDVVVEANGLAFDVVLFGVVILWLDEMRQKRERRRGYHDQLEDYRDWRTEEAALRTAGLVRRISRDGGAVHAPRAHLPGANLKEAHLRRAHLKGADLSGAWLLGADLRGASLVAADLSGTRLDGAKLDGADLSYARRTSDDPPVPGWSLDAQGRLTR